MLLHNVAISRKTEVGSIRDLTKVQIQVSAKLFFPFLAQVFLTCWTEFFFCVINIVTAENVKDS